MIQEGETKRKVKVEKVVDEIRMVVIFDIEGFNVRFYDFFSKTLRQKCIKKMLFSPNSYV